MDAPKTIENTSDENELARRRIIVNRWSLWYNADHEGVKQCIWVEYLSVRQRDMDLLLQGSWTSRQILPGDDVTAEDRAHMYGALADIQAWLIFGFIEDLLQPEQRLKVADYLVSLPEDEVAKLKERFGDDSRWQQLRDKSGAVHVIDTQRLVSDFTALIKLKDPRKGIWANAEVRTGALLQFYVQQFNKLAALKEIYPSAKVEDALSTVLQLPRLLFEAVRFHLPDFMPDMELLNTTEYHFDALKDDLMRKNRWCPSILHRLHHATNFNVICWLWSSGFNSLEKVDHPKCRPSKCFARTTPPEDQPPTVHEAHCDGQDCKVFQHGLVNKMFAILKSDCFPVVVATPSEKESIGYTIEVEGIDPNQTKDVIPYVAFSHTWSDGLSSKMEIGILFCQVRHLADVARRQLNSKDESVAFWIDSMCLPLKDEERKKAIKAMAATYEKAKAVVVLDNTLKSVKTEDDAGDPVSAEYLLFRIYTCPWNQRVWTYQEAALAKKLMFIFADGDKDFKSLLNINENSTFRQGRSNLIYDILESHSKALDIEAKTPNIGMAALELRWRHTRHRDPKGKNDEILAVGALLKLDLETLQNFRAGQDRMVCFYTQIGRLHRNIIFSNVGRVDRDGFRWAPNTFLTNDVMAPFTNLTKNGVDCNREGLLGTYWVFTPSDGNQWTYDDKRRVTLIAENWKISGIMDKQFVSLLNSTIKDRRGLIAGEPQGKWDIEPLDDSRSRFEFTHIILYPVFKPWSVEKGTKFPAVAVIKDHGFSTSSSVDMVGTFKELINLSWNRDIDALPLEKYRDNMSIHGWTMYNTEKIYGRVDKMKVLLR